MNARRSSRGSVAASVAAGALGTWALYYTLRCRLPPRIRAGKTTTNAALLARLPILQQPYSPPIWAVSTWVQVRHIFRVADIGGKARPGSF